jgi:peptidyl-prolyl cis-trans isomerase SurA
MKIKLFLILIFYFFISFSTYTLAISQNKIVVKIENEIITDYEIKNKILTLLFMAKQELNQENINNQKKQVLNQLINHKLKKIELSKYNYKKNQKQIDQYLNSISSNNSINLKKEFINKNLNYELFLEEIETHFKWQQLIYNTFQKKILIDEKNVEIQIENFIKNKASIEEFRISEIEVPSNDNKLNKEKILDLSKKIEEEGFENIALKYSSSITSPKKGDLGWVNAKYLSKNIYEILKNMKIGEVSNPIIKPDSILFLKLNNKRASKPESINKEELKKNLINQKKNELFNLYSRSYLSKLKNTSYIEYKCKIKL